VVAQKQAPAKLEVGHDFWGFKESAPQGVQAFAQTSDGLLWLGTALGLYRFDGTRFELFHSPFGDQLSSTNIYSLFAPESGGLWIGYTIGGFSFLKDGRVKNYAGEIAFSTGSVFNFAQDANGVLWAATVRGLWKFDHSHWQHVGPEANVPPEKSLKRGSIMREAFGPWQALSRGQRSFFVSDMDAISSRRLRVRCILTALLWISIEWS
jgi:hypothetical protein